MTDDVGEQTDELCAPRIDGSILTPRKLELDLQRLGYRGLRPQPRDDAAAKEYDQAIGVATGTQYEGAKLFVACGQRVERRGRRLSADEFVVPPAFPTRLNALSTLRG